MTEKALENFTNLTIRLIFLDIHSIIFLHGSKILRFKEEKQILFFLYCFFTLT